MPRGRPKKEVPDSSPQPSELGASSPQNSSTMVPAVLIPNQGPSRMTRSTRQSLSTAASSMASTRSDNSDEYETPATSAIGTPVAVSSKRKRSTRASYAQTDQALAEALQEQEYMEADGDDGQSDNDDELALHASGDDSEDDGTGHLVSSDDSEDDMPMSKRRRPLPVRSRGTSFRRGRASAGKARERVRRELDGVDDTDGELSEAYISSDDLSTDDENLASTDEDANSTAVPQTQSRRQRRRLENLRGSRGVAAQGNRKTRQRRRLEAAHPNIKTMWDDLRAIPKIPTAQVPQPDTITRQLKGFQLEGLNWMIEQEKTQWKGGLLGDEMGMGKTIQAVSLIMSDYPAPQPTLVVVPPVALMQWTNEINEYTNGKLKVLLYHGTNSKAKSMSVKELKKFDVIMISYSGLESLHRKETKGWARKEQIIKEDSAIHAIQFHRLILDEAHSIKSRTTGVAKACFALKGTYKWCLSGTPVQNRIGEFFSLLRFLEVQPFANYYCKSCPCSTMHWKVDADYKCVFCHHRQLDHVSVFNQEILNPITAPDEDGDEASRKAAFAKLRLLTERMMLRRLKRDYTASMELPPKEVIIHNEFFGEIEKDFANSIMGSSTRKFDTYVSRGVMLDNYANIFGLIMQMRQIADHPDLITKKRAEGGQNVLVCNICDEPAEEAIRSKCKHDFCRTCAKDFVRTCEESGATADCPRCHIALSIDFDQPDIEQDEDSVKSNSIINRIKMENWTSSTKIEMLVYDLWKLRSKKQTTKSIVFSQFTSMLQLVEWRLRRAGFNTVMLDGSMTPAQRQKSIEHFMTNADVEVFLVSLKAGGVALNLTEASRIFIIDPWWNPAAEWQSADRCHRIGQRRPCVITRLVVEDSIESRIVMLQEKKAHMINGTVNNDDVSMEKLTPQDMQFLFRGS